MKHAIVLLRNAVGAHSYDGREVLSFSLFLKRWAESGWAPTTPESIKEGEDYSPAAIQ